MNNIKTKIVGVTFDDHQKNIADYGHSCIRYFNLDREPENQHDPYAIRVGLGPWKFGYLPRALAEKLAPIMDDGRKFEAEFVSRNVSPEHETVGLTVKIIEITK